MWPVAGWFLVVVSPNVGIQATQTNTNLSMERPALLRRFFKPIIAGGDSLFDLPEQEWKPWRPIFNKGFSTEHILSMVPGMIKQTRIYAETLRNLARQNELFYLDPVTLRFTMDLVGQTVLNTELGAQKGYNTFADCMLSQLRWHDEGDKVLPLGKLDVVRQFMYWWNGRQMDQYIGKELDKRFDDFKNLDSADGSRRSVIDLVLAAYMNQATDQKPSKLDDNFRAFAISQIRLFMFAGHDSTSSSICYCLHLLSTHPETLERLRSEHDIVFGKEDISAAATILEQDPNTVNSLPFTTAVIKETLRLFPPAASIRKGKYGEFLVNDQGTLCPTENTMIQINHLEMHRAPKYWIRPEEFLPARWLVEPGHELYPVKGAWRPFEHGPRNCIAQGLVMVELRVILACIVREFEFKSAYEEWDLLHPIKGLRTYKGERAYQVAEGAAHPVDHYPCRVSLRRA